MKKTTMILAALLAVTMIGVSLTSCTAPITGDDTEAMAYITMRINPEIELLTDENGVVVAVNPVNEDGEVVLCDLDLVGETIEEAGEQFAAESAELGYLDTESEDATVYVDVESEDDELKQDLEKNLTERITSYFKNNGINGKVSPETIEKYAEKAAEWNVSAGHVKMIMRVLDMYPDMTDEQVLAMSVSERMALLKSANKGKGKPDAEQKQAFKTTVTDLKTKYAWVFALRQEIDDITVQLENPDLDAEQRTALETQLAEKQASYIEGFAQYKDELHIAKDNTKKGKGR